jgi:CheY-like chemotaxis protein
MQGYLVSPPVPAQKLQTMLYTPGSETMMKPEVFARIHALLSKSEREEEERLASSTLFDNNDKQITILLADDDEDDRLMARDALREARLANDLHYVANGEELIDYLHRRGKYADPAHSPRPGLILLDLNMPKKDGREALREIKSDEDFRRIPVVVLTTSNAEGDIFRTYDLGVNSFITKPVTFEGLVEVMKMLGRYWFQIVELPNDKIR